VLDNIAGVAVALDYTIVVGLQINAYYVYYNIVLQLAAELPPVFPSYFGGKGTVPYYYYLVDPADY
jgi:hypothetical protein